MAGRVIGSKDYKLEIVRRCTTAAKHETVRLRTHRHVHTKERAAGGRGIHDSAVLHSTRHCGTAGTEPRFRHVSPAPEPPCPTRSCPTRIFPAGVH